MNRKWKETSTVELAHSMQRPRMATTMAAAEPPTRPRPGSMDEPAPVLPLFPPWLKFVWVSPPTACVAPGEFPAAVLDA
jgi:hypothetical protein